MLSCKNFTEEELACNHCGENKCQDEMVSLLQKLRDVPAQADVDNITWPAKPE